jgi:Ser/Thr protein kinase RdoA (MazF antagonist)
MAGEFTPEVVADLHGVVAGSLARWGLPPDTDIRLLNISENATFALCDVKSKRDWVLRVHRIGYSSAEEIRSELAWIEALRRAAVIDTATPVFGSNGDCVQTLEPGAGRRPRHAVAFERLPGKEPDAGSEAPRWFERLGELTAKMHGHAKVWSLPPGFRRKRWDLAAMVGDEGYWGPWRAALGLDRPGRLAIEQALSLIGQRLERFGSGPARFGLVHADLRLANLLVDGAALSIIDFDDCGFSWFMYDFATSVSFIEHEAIVPELLRAWLVGYTKTAPLLPEEKAEIPTFVILRRILLTAWLASHADVPFARQLGAAYTRGTVTLAREFLGGRFLNSVSTL